MSEPVAEAHRTVSRFGWKPSLPDPRDVPADISGLQVKPEVDPRADMQPIYDQGQLGSCTANAVARAIEYDRILDGLHLGTPSRLGLYWLERFVEGGLGQTRSDTGAFGRDGFKVAKRYGTVPESLIPYDPAQFTADPRPTMKLHTTAKLTKPYHAVPANDSSIKAVLSNRQTVALGISVFASFESPEVAHTGVVPLPAASEAMIGGHEVLIVGYLKDHPGYYLCANSWSASWGMAGYFLLPVAYATDPKLAADHRTIVRSL